MTLPVRQDGRLNYAAVARDLRGRLVLLGLWHFSEAERKTRVDKAYWGRIWTWIVAGLAVLVTAWVVW